MLSMGGGGITNGEDVSYGNLFKPLINAMDVAKLEIDTKLKEHAYAWIQFNTDLGNRFRWHRCTDGKQGRANAVFFQKQ